MRIFAFWTCDRVSPESAAEGMIDDAGWVNYRGSRTIFASRNYVSPEINMPVDDEDLADEVRELGLEGAVDSGDGMFYFEQEDVDYETGDTYTYAIHFLQKYNTPQGWVERPWHPGSLVKELA